MTGSTLCMLDSLQPGGWGKGESNPTLLMAPVSPAPKKPPDIKRNPSCLLCDLTVRLASGG